MERKLHLLAVTIPEGTVSPKMLSEAHLTSTVSSVSKIKMINRIPRFAALFVIIISPFFNFSHLEAQNRRIENDATVERAIGVARKSLATYGGETLSLSFKNATYEYEAESVGSLSSKVLRVKAYFKNSDFFRSDVIGEKAITITVLNPDKGWLMIDESVLSLDRRNLEPFKAEVIAQLRPDLLLLAFQKLHYFGRTEEDGHKLDQVDVSGFIGGEYTRGRLSFDLSNNLVYKYEFESERESPSGKGLIHGESKYIEYRDVEGLKVPVEIISTQAGKVSRIKVIQIDLKTVIDESTFSEPSRLAPKAN
ncbi:MAG TPA: hypothetical protein VJ044_07410 [Candidatus Hodarchaeales archaeon]|nr:hypothetical protein [Candidatus Hodarchaeales archaeon]